MNNYKVVLATLDGCSACAALKELLRENNVKFTDVVCDTDPKLCDELEKLTGSSKYPMAIIKDITQNLNYVYYTSFDYNELGKERTVDEKVKTIGYFSPEEILKKIKSI